MDERDTLIARIDALESASERLRMDASLEALLSLPLTVQQLKVTAVIVMAGGNATSQRIAEILQVSLATVSGIIDRLVGQGMVERVPDERDRRSRRLVATERGRGMIESMLIDANAMRRAALARLEIGDLRALVQGLEALTRAAFTDDGAPGPGAG